ncbi:MAG: metabolite traffic protein EboE [Armatimonadetes bacterium]|nr:metabolite traffic protein EboE [Armatimonadota bacterium]
MQLPDSDLLLTYCTNIHPGDGWEEVFANLQRFAPALKERLAPQSPFGIGLRLSARESEELLGENRLREFGDWLRENGLYVALINGFPFGSFHRRVIKEDVFAPDWRDEERVLYTLRLIRILGELLPDDVDGGISTSPLAYKRWIAEGDDAAWETMTRNIARVAAELVQVRRESGKLIHLDIEPEPDGLIENSEETIAFFEKWLLPQGAPLLAEWLDVPLEAARRHLLEHVQICFDTCHFAVEYENPVTALERFAASGIKIGRVQVSSALKIPLPDDAQHRADLSRQLAPFAESTYLHQVIEQHGDGSLHHHRDLSEALPFIEETVAKQWRVHFHVPLFVADYGLFGSTREDIGASFERLRGAAFTRHLEIETYTWDVLPPALKQDLLESIHREYRWVLDELGATDESAETKMTKNEGTSPLLLAQVQQSLQNDGATGANLEMLLDRILGRFGCVVGTIHSFDPQSEMLTLRAQRGIPDSILNQVRAIPIGKGMAGLAAQRREPVQVCNLQTDDTGVAKPGARDTRMEGAISVPLLVDGELRGTLGVSKPQAYEFTPTEIEELQHIGALLGKHLEA